MKMGLSDHLTCVLRSLHTGQEATVRTKHGTTDWFKIEKKVCQGCILSPCLVMCREHEYMLSHFNCTNSATLWTVAHQAPLSTGCSRHEYWSGCHDLLQGIFLTLGLNLSLVCLLHWQAGSLSLAPPGKPPYAECIIRNAGLDESQWNQDCREKYQQPQICR